VTPAQDSDNASEAHWPASIAVLAALSLQVTLPDALIVGPRWILPALELLLLVPLTITRPHRRHSDPRPVRMTSIVLIALVNIANIGSLVLLAHDVITGRQIVGRQLIFSSIEIWLTNVLIFALWFWELDRRGPGARTLPKRYPPDFLFPQMANPDGCEVQKWRPNFIDYLYTSLTNATAFSPTDTMPLSSKVKALMGVQCIASLITVVLVAARAVNILN
jgi:uncharacterized membrane protein